MRGADGVVLSDLSFAPWRRAGRLGRWIDDPLPGREQEPGGARAEAASGFDRPCPATRCVALAEARSFLWPNAAATPPPT